GPQVGATANARRKSTPSRAKAARFGVETGAPYGLHQRPASCAWRRTMFGGRGGIGVAAIDNNACRFQGKRGEFHPDEILGAAGRCPGSFGQTPDRCSGGTAASERV